VVISTKILTYEQDHLGRKVSYVHNGKTTVKYFYDAIGRLITKKFSSSGTTQGSKQTGNWSNASSWLSGTLPTIADNVTINTGQTITIPSGESAFAGILNDKGIVKNFGTLNMGKATSADLYNQSISYHIRGGLKGINLDASGNLTNNLFSYKLDYENGVNGLFDGNISKQSWKSNIDGKARSYEFSYDGASRLKSGTYGSIPAGENYSLNNVDYDLNGNIKALSRSGATNTNYTSFGNVDNLTYTYQNYSNKLLKIADATTTNADLGDFRDGTNTDNDYEYWADGSLKKDKNKKIASITYNYLKLPEIITFDDSKTITTEYDAGGTKLKKIVSGGETTDYEEDDIYVNNVLYQTSHDEGRIANGIYEYNITDHNNDLRIAFKDSLGIAVPTQSIFYDPWGLTMKGMAITRNPLNFNRYQFLNRELQIETGLVDLMKRQYNPQTGQFTSQDPVIEGQEHLSLYQYGWNNPILRPDPNGLMPDDEPWYKKAWSSTVSAVKSASAWAGSVMTESSNLRKTYQVESSKLVEKTPENNLKRLELKANIRDATPQPMKAILDKSRPMTGETSKVASGTVNNPSKTNSSVNALSEKIGKAGTVITGIGLAISVKNIATSDSPMKQAGIESGGWSGAYSGGVLAAEAATPSGNPYVIGASGFVGSIVGGIFGQEAVKQIQNVPTLPAITLLPR
jgi:RHS repeat-associated protein